MTLKAWANVFKAAAAGAVATAAMLCAASAEGTGSATTAPIQAVEGAVARVTLTIGKGGLFETSAPYAKISVTDEKVVQVTPQSDRDLLFNPRGVGSTNVFVFDDKNNLIARLDVNVVDATVRIKGEAAKPAPPQDVVTVYNRIYDPKGGPVKPTLYQCTSTNCQGLGEAGNLAPDANPPPPLSEAAKTSN